MVTNIKISSLIILILCIFGCQNAEQKPIKKIEKNFGLYENESDSIAVELKLNEFNNWNELLERTEQIVCNDSLPKITFNNNSIIKRVYLRNPCWEGIGCILIKQKNTIQIHNDTISKSDRFFYPLDSLTSVLKKDFENNGKIPSWSVSPEKLMIFISYDNNNMERLPKTIERVLNEYEKLTDSVVLKIWLNEKFDIPPPPPPPKKIDEIELIENKK
ncbi:hypothetical protein [Winogradskyella aquimaris]|uniref:Uncharacterized protein n=1 Tax=Winogradskyella aquimaris TaxID=864074 RepID=A0ABU5EUM6_9FLAO|nr:hypothetical protein [Winogradskyella aquimaris]MDY2588509.1 hypothetical protein [Winogradskyella aquimaris]